jgi:Uncharacterized conserved protein
MIKSIELRNFKSIKKKYFPLRKLNLLLGLNGMGKSSFIQSLLLLRQSENLAKRGELKLNGLPNGYVNIGTTKDARYQYAKKEDTIDFFLQFKGSDLFEMRFNYEFESDILTARNELPGLYPPTFDYSYISEHRREALFSENFQYLSATRISPQSIHVKSFNNVVKLRNIGNYGEYTAHFIDTFYNEDIIFENLTHKESVFIDVVLGIVIENKTLLNQINLWMGEISPGVNIRTTSISSDEVMLEYVYKQPNFGSTNRFKPENVGFGISYALHVVTALLTSRPGELIIIENPESHIHSKGQAKLGQLIALTAQNDVQIIIETHSDHLINGVRVAVKENPELKDEAIIFYFDKIVTDTEQFSRITNIEIDKNGELSDYPKDMLDEWGNQLFKLM